MLSSQGGMKKNRLRTSQRPQPWRMCDVMSQYAPGLALVPTSIGENPFSCRLSDRLYIQTDGAATFGDSADQSARSVFPRNFRFRFWPNCVTLKLLPLFQNLHCFPRLRIYGPQAVPQVSVIGWSSLPLLLYPHSLRLRGRDTRRLKHPGAAQYQSDPAGGSRPSCHYLGVPGECTGRDSGIQYTDQR